MPEPWPRSSSDTLAWPGVSSPAASGTLALLYQLENSQWWPAERLRAAQLAQLHEVLRYAGAHSPHYARAFKQAGVNPEAPLTEDVWRRVPMLTRETLQSSFAGVSCRRVPPSHGEPRDSYTSGSTGQMVRVRMTALLFAMQRAIAMRDHIWHQRDLSRTFAQIRYIPDGDAEQGRTGVDGWADVDHAFVSGSSAWLDIAASVEEQVAWLQEVKPAYLTTFPSNLRALSRHCIDERISLPSLRQAMAFSESLTDDIKAQCHEAWGVPVIDGYSAQEVGHIALQCPEHDGYHSAAESLLVEVLDDDGRQCGPGEVGNVVVSSLLNFATPLIRYRIGDLAEVGAACPCGRGLPALRRILGRERDMIQLPDGSKILPSILGMLDDVTDVKQFQIHRVAEEQLDVHLITDGPLAADQAEALRRNIVRNFRYPFAVTLRYVERIDRLLNGKFKDIVSEID